MEAQYTPEFFAAIREGCKRSAARIGPRVIDLLHPLSVVDLGCGEGHWLAEFKRLGVPKIVGVDGWPPGEHHAIAHDRSEYYIRDMQDGFTNAHTWPKFDLAISLEVAEHLPESATRHFIRALCHLAPVVLFSAAIPGQGGLGHVNERWQSWWAERFREEGYFCYDELRWRIWRDTAIEPWYRQNLMIFFDPMSAKELLPGTFPPIDCVHPEIFNWRLADIRSLRGQ